MSEAQSWQGWRDADVAKFMQAIGRAFPVTAMADDRDERDEDDGAGQTSVIVRTRPKLKKPNMYRVLLLNDDYTPMDFVVSVLVRYFAKTPEDAVQIMWTVHESGAGECGIYTYEVAETKVTQVIEHARKNQHPLQCVMEET